MGSFLELLKREFRLFWNNSVLRLLFIGAPLAYGVVFGLVYQKGKVTDLNIIVVDKDQSPLSNRVIDMLNDNEVLNVAEVLNERIDLKEKLIALDAQAVVVIPERFEADILQTRTPEIDVNLNLSNILTANYASRAVQLVLGSLDAGMEMEALRKKGTPEHAVEQKYHTFSINFARLYNPASNYMGFLWPGMLATIVQQVLLLAMALSFAREFEEGTFGTELLSKTASPVLAMLVKCLPFWLILIPIGLCFWLMQQYFHVALAPAQLGAGLLLCVLFVTATSFLGILVSVLIPNQLKATEVLMVVATPAFVLSGFTWPLSQMPQWIAQAAQIIPLTHFLEGYRILLTQDGNLAHITNHLYNLGILTIVLAVGSYLALIWKMKNKEKNV